MKFSNQCLSFWVACIAASTNLGQVNGEENTCVEAPFIAPKVTLAGKVITDFKLLDELFKIEDVKGCCSSSSSSDDGATFELETIGQMAQMSTEQTMQVLEEAKQAWNGGMGTWPQMTLEQRVETIQNFFTELQAQRENIVRALMWEIGKNRKDAESEFDRTVQFAEQVVQIIKTDPEFLATNWQKIGSVNVFTRRAAVGIIMCLGPMNYPLNETYATLIPALLMGNVAIMKIPTVGGLAHLLTMEAFAKTLPPGTMNFVSGRGRDTMPPLMKTGDIDCLAFIGGSNAADDLIKQHPHPHRLKVFLQLEAKNMGVSTVFS